jgi:hypothetical protein
LDTPYPTFLQNKIKITSCVLNSSTYEIGGILPIAPSACCLLALFWAGAFQHLKNWLVISWKAGLLNFVIYIAYLHIKKTEKRL